ncbi:MAG: nitrogenase component 1, partial [Pseudomonadota bacterium]
NDLLEQMLTAFGANDMSGAANWIGLEALVTDDYLEVEAAIAEAAPELILGTQMERHIGKRLGIPCAVISAPVHVQDFPARYSPQMGFEGANVLFDTWVHPLVMGLEEHLLAMFRDDFEFHDRAGPSHLHGAAPAEPGPGRHQPAAGEGGSTPPETGLETELETGRDADPSTDKRDPPQAEPSGAPIWALEAESELRKIPFFVRGKARRNTERFAAERGVATITVETLYDAKAHFAR